MSLRERNSWAIVGTRSSSSLNSGNPLSRSNLKNEFKYFHMSDVLGISLTLVGTFLAALGYALQKKALTEIGTSKVRVYQNYKWLIGLVCMVVSALLVVASSTMLDQSKSAPLGAATLVFSSILAAVLLHERFTVLHLISTITIISGTILAITATSSASVTYSFEQVLNLLIDALVMSYTILVVTAMVIAIYYLETISKYPQRLWTKTQNTFMMIASPMVGGFANGFVGYSVKVVSTVFTTSDWGAFATFAIYLYIVISVLSVFAQVRYLNKGLEFFSSLRIVPIFQSSIIFSNSFAGIVYFHEMRSASATTMFIFFLGAFICVAGIVLLLMQKEFPQQPTTPTTTPKEKPAQEVIKTDNVSEWSSSSADKAEKPSSLDGTVVKNPVAIAVTTASAPPLTVVAADERDTAPMVVQRMNWYDEELHVFVRRLFTSKPKEQTLT
jgi:Magnesium transporter NIPA